MRPPRPAPARPERTPCPPGLPGFNWADDGHPNSVPLYQSSGGYGVYRNTWSPGVYDFESAAASTVRTVLVAAMDHCSTLSYVTMQTGVL